MNRLGLILTSVVILAASPQAFGQDRTITVKKEGDAAVGAFEVDTAIPDAPGFSVIGIKPATVLDPGTQRINFVDLLSFVDDNGDLKTGAAVGGSPLWWFNPPSLDAYRATSGLAQAAYRTELSIGYAKGATGKPDRVGYGFRTQLLSTGDFRMDDQRYDCLKRAISPSAVAATDNIDTALDKAIGDLRAEQFRKYSAPDERAVLVKTINDDRAAKGLPPLAGSALDQAVLGAIGEKSDAALDSVLLTDRFRTAAKKCESDFAARVSDKPSWILAGGWAERTNATSGPRSDGGSVWTSYRHPLIGNRNPKKGAVSDSKSYWTLFARYDFDKVSDKDPAGPVRYDSTVVATALGWENQSNKLSLQAGYQNLTYGPSSVLKDDGFAVGTLDWEFKVRDDAWIALLAGASGQKGLSKSANHYVQIQIHYAPPKAKP